MQSQIDKDKSIYKWKGKERQSQKGRHRGFKPHQKVISTNPDEKQQDKR